MRKLAAEVLPFALVFAGLGVDQRRTGLVSHVDRATFGDRLA